MCADPSPLPLHVCRCRCGAVSKQRAPVHLCVHVVCVNATTNMSQLLLAGCCVVCRWMLGTGLQGLSGALHMCGVLLLTAGQGASGAHCFLVTGLPAVVRRSASGGVFGLVHRQVEALWRRAPPGLVVGAVTVCLPAAPTEHVSGVPAICLPGCARCF